MSKKDGLVIKGKSVDIDYLKLKNSRLNVTSEGDLNLTDSENNGEYPKSLSNASISLNAKGNVFVSNCTLDQQCYNALEISLASGYEAKNVVIKGVDFTADEYATVNNAISIFGWQENATITIADCKFKYVSNALRLSNTLNVPATINIVNCEAERWDTSDEWAGFLIMQDYTSKSKEESETANRFHNVTVNIENLTGPNGKVTGSPEDICATGSADTQVIYIYNDKEGLVPYSVDRYPTITIS